MSGTPPCLPPARAAFPRRGRAPRWPRAALGACILLLAGAPCPASEAVTQPSLADEVKAVFVYKFQIYVRWPGSAFAAPGASFNLCTVGPSGLDGLIGRAVAGQTHEGHPIQLLHLQNLVPASHCHLAFIAGQNPDFLRRQIAAAAGFPTLLVTDTAGPARGMINFVIAEDRVRFAIDQDEAARAGLGISSKLMHLAIAATED